MNLKRQFLAVLTAAMSAAAIAAETISFQGRLTDDGGQPIAGNPTIRVEIWDAATGGAKRWPTSGTGEFTVATNESGLFTVDIGPFADDFFSFGSDAFVHLYVLDTGGSFQSLLPRRKLTPVAFAFSAKNAARAGSAATADQVGADSVGSQAIQDGAIQHVDLSTDAVRSDVIQDGTIENQDIADGAIGAQKLDLASVAGSTLPFVPSGMIALFNGACPDDWTRFDALDGRFPLGGSVPSMLGGTSNHDHGLATGGGHGHGVTGPANRTGTRLGQPVANIEQFNDEYLEDVAVGNLKRFGTHNHTTGGDGDHDHGGATGAVTDLLPPYVTVVYCQKD